MRVQIPPLPLMQRWCNGNTTVSKTVVLGSKQASLRCGAVGKLVKPPVFQAGDCGFKPRRHYFMGRLAYWCGQLSVKQSVLVAGSIPARPIIWRGRYWQSKLFAVAVVDVSSLWVQLPLSPPENVV